MTDRRRDIARALITGPLVPYVDETGIRPPDAGVAFAPGVGRIGFAPPEAMEAASLGAGMMEPMGSSRPSYDPQGRSVSDTVQRVFGLNPDMERGAILPLGRMPGGETEFAAPQWAYEMAKALALPGHVMKGGAYTPEDAINMGLTVAGGGGAVGATKAVPRGSLAMGGSRPRQMSLPLQGGQGVRFPLDEASRMERAQQLGFTEEVYHGTRATQPIDSFLPKTGPQRHDLWGVHVGTKSAADDRLRQYFGARDYGVKSGLANEGQAASIMPLLARIRKPYTKADGSPYTEAEIRKKVTAFARKRGLNPDRLDTRRAFQKELRDEGYDAIPYVNSKEDRGNVSYLIFDPQNIRSRFAKFDPAKSDSADLLAANASPLAAALAGVPVETQRNRQ